MSYSLEKATALLVRELNAAPDSPLAHPSFQNLLLAPTGPARDHFVQNAVQQAGVTLHSLDLPSAPVGALHDEAGIRTFAQTLKAAAQALQADGGGLLVLNDLDRTSQVLQNVAIFSMSPASLHKAGLDRVHVLWTADPNTPIPSGVIDRLLPMALDLSPAQVQRLETQNVAATTHVRIPNLTTLVGNLPALKAQADRAHPAPGLKAAHA